MKGNFYISQDDWKKIHDYAKIAYGYTPPSEGIIASKPWKNEIGGMAVLIKQEDGWLIQDPVILEQEVHGTICVLDKDALAVYYSDMFAKHGTVRFLWWHSHHMMSASWSSTDTDTIEENATTDWSASLLINLKGDHKLRIQFFQPVECSYDTEVEIVGTQPTTVPKAMIDEVVSKVTEKTHTYVHAGSYKRAGTYTSKEFEHYSGRNEPDYTKPIDLDYANQLSMFNYGIEDDVDEAYVVDYITGLNKEYVKGTIQYNQWRNLVRKSNKSLREYGFRIVEWKKKRLERDIYVTEPTEFISYDIRGLA